METISSKYLQKVFSPRSADANKGTFGQAVIVGGSANYAGAPQFAAESASSVLSSLAAVLTAQGESAMLSGAGTSVLAVPDFLAQAIYQFVKFSAIYPLKSSNGAIVFDSGELETLLKKSTAVGIGCGMGAGECGKIIDFILHRTGQKIVVDADALNTVSSFKFSHRAVLTPHLGEMSRMSGYSVSDLEKHGAEICAEYALSHECTVVLKSRVSYVSDGATVFKNLTGNVKLAKGGSGDVLCGIITGLLAWGVRPLEAAACGTYILGRAAELSPVNEFSHLPTDITAQIANVIGETIDGRY